MSHEHLVVIDMQQGFLENKNPEEVFRTTAIIQSIVLYAREHNIPITFTMYPEDEYGKIINELNPIENEIIVKNDPSVFTSEDFVERTKKTQVLLVVGCNLHACIRLTVRDALTHGMEVIVFDNAVLANTYYPQDNLGTWIEFFLKPTVHVQSYDEELFWKYE